jgi:hypothetical protein
MGSLFSGVQSSGIHTGPYGAPVIISGGMFSGSSESSV